MSIWTKILIHIDNNMAKHMDYNPNQHAFTYPSLYPPLHLPYIYHSSPKLTFRPLTIYICMNIWIKILIHIDNNMAKHMDYNPNQHAFTYPSFYPP